MTAPKQSRFSLLQLAVQNLSDSEDGHWADRFPNPDFVGAVIGSTVSQSELMKFGRVRRAPPPVVVVAPAIPGAVDVVPPGDLREAIVAADAEVVTGRLAVKMATDNYARSRRDMTAILAEWTSGGVTAESNARSYIASEQRNRAHAVALGAPQAPASVPGPSHLDRLQHSRFTAGPGGRDRGYSRAFARGAFPSSARGGRVPPKV